MVRRAGQDEVRQLEKRPQCELSARFPQPFHGERREPGAFRHHRRRSRRKDVVVLDEKFLAARPVRRRSLGVRHLDIDEAARGQQRARGGEHRHGILDMLQHLVEGDGVDRLDLHRRKLLDRHCMGRDADRVAQVCSGARVGLHGDHGPASGLHGGGKNADAGPDIEQPLPRRRRPESSAGECDEARHPAGIVGALGRQREHLLEASAHARRAAIGGIDIAALVQRREVDRVAAEPVPAQAAAVVGTRVLRRRQVEADLAGRWSVVDEGLGQMAARAGAAQGGPRPAAQAASPRRARRASSASVPSSQATTSRLSCTM